MRRSQYQSRTACGLSLNPCGVAYFSTSTCFHSPSSVRKAEIPLSTLRPALTENHWCIGILAPFLCGFHQFIQESGSLGSDPSQCHFCIPSLEPKRHCPQRSPIYLNPRDLWVLRGVRTPNHLVGVGLIEIAYQVLLRHRIFNGTGVSDGQSFRPPLLGSVGQSVDDGLPHFQVGTTQHLLPRGLQALQRQVIDHWTDIQTIVGRGHCLCQFEKSRTNLLVNGVATAKHANPVGLDSCDSAVFQ